MTRNLFSAASRLAIAAVIAMSAIPLRGQTGKPKRVFMITDMEGVDGIFNFDLQCIPLKSPRYEESHKLLAGEVSAAVDGLVQGGAAEVLVYDGHAGSRTLSPFDLSSSRARLLQGTPISPTLELDSSYSAVIFIGLHAMAGAEKAILPHSYTWDIENIWVNGKRTGEIGGRTMLAGALGVPVIMLSGDAAACKEFHDLVPDGECAEVKSGVSASAGISLSHHAACDLILNKAAVAMAHLNRFKPYKISGPVELKVEFKAGATKTFTPGSGIEQINDRTWVFRGKDIMEAWLKYGSF